MENSSLDELNEEGTTSTNEGRNRRPPDWMRDFVSGEGLSKEEEEEDMANLAMFTAADPVHYYKAVKSEKWRKAIGLEIQAIEKNCTWK